MSPGPALALSKISDRVSRVTVGIGGFVEELQFVFFAPFVASALVAVLCAVWLLAASGFTSSAFLELALPFVLQVRVNSLGRA